MNNTHGIDCCVKGGKPCDCGVELELRRKLAAAMHIVIAILPEDCIARTCDCEPGECRFARCPECDGLVTDDGWTIDPRGCCFTCKAD